MAVSRIMMVVVDVRCTCKVQGEASKAFEAKFIDWHLTTFSSIPLVSFVLLACMTLCLPVCEMLRPEGSAKHFRDMLAPDFMTDILQMPTASSAPHVTDGKRTGGSSFIYGSDEQRLYILRIVTKCKALKAAERGLDA